MSDNELVYLETIHLFVELLDSYFSNVCELDIVFNFNKVYAILDEYILAGEMQETSKKQILERIRDGRVRRGLSLEPPAPFPPRAGLSCARARACVHMPRNRRA